MSRHVVSAIPPPAEGFQGQAAGIVSRTLAAGIDGIVVATILLAGYVGSSAVRFVWNPRTFTFPAPDGWFSVAAAGLIATAYLTVGWWIAGRSYGCAVMGLRVVGRDGRDLHFAPALVRAVVCVLFPLGLAWCALDRGTRALHDLLTRSRVIYDWRHQEQ